MSNPIVSDESGFKYRFGTYGSKQPLKNNGTDVIIQNTRVYLCPWQLKHVDTISVSVGGSTATMGIPNKPQSRTQIFDTSGPTLTFKISGRRYEQEETISNWDFVNTQFNFQQDEEFGVPASGELYCYIGLNWLLSCMQILLKGYVLYIDNSKPNDTRFIFKRSTTSPPEEGYNVALTSVNTTFSETEPGLLEYSLTLVMRFKRGECLYKPYLGGEVW